MAAALPPPAVGASLRLIPGVGRHIAAEITRLYGVRDLQELADLVNGFRSRAQTQRFVDDVTRNPRACECLEGYVVRVHNRQGREGLIDWMVGAAGIPPARRPLYSNPHLSRDATRNDGSFYGPTVVGVGARRPTEGGWPYPYARPSRRALPRAGPAPPPTYPYGRHDYKGSDLEAAGTNRAARDAILRTRAPGEAGAAASRRYWPCACFRSRQTCQDFNPGRQNRRGSGQPPCAWRRGHCVEVAAAAPLR